MLETLELGLFGLATALYALAWGWHLAGWNRRREGKSDA
jgi:hypothetical protein